MPRKQHRPPVSRRILFRGLRLGRHLLFLKEQTVLVELNELEKRSREY